MQIAVVDDEQNYIEEIKCFCREYRAQGQDAVQVSSFSNGQAFLDTFEAGLYQLVFMDIFMEGMNGVDTAQKMREKDHSCFLVFLTSSTDYMPDAFACHAFDYVVKPFNRQRIVQVLSDVQKHLPELPPYIEITSGRQTVPLLLSDIVSVVSAGHYLDICTQDGTHVRSRMTVDRFLQLANNDSRFLSANRGILVNADYIDELSKECCTMANGVKFPIRTRDSQCLESAMRQYHFAKLRSEQYNRWT